MAIVVCGDLQLEKHIGYWVQDCSAATENLLLAIHAKGLGRSGLAYTLEKKGLPGSEGCLEYQIMSSPFHSSRSVIRPNRNRRGPTVIMR